jgi:hypothetical protein
MEVLRVVELLLHRKIAQVGHDRSCPPLVRDTAEPRNGDRRKQANDEHDRDEFPL